MRHLKTYGIFESDMRKDLDYIRSIMSGEQLRAKVLYHLTDMSNMEEIRKKGIIPKMPKSSVHGGNIKGEKFSGVWLTKFDDIDVIVEEFMLPKKLRTHGVLFKINVKDLDPKKFVVGIEMPTDLFNKAEAGKKISVNEYLERSGEVVYLDTIPVGSIKIIDGPFGIKL